MLRGFVRMSETEHLSADAGEALKRIYGRDAAPALQEAIREARSQDRAARMQRILDAL